MTIFLIIISIILLVVISEAFSNKRKIEFDADFLHSSEIMSSFNKGYCLTGRKSLTIQDSFKNALIIGSTGNYKSSGILIPSILKMRGHSSLVITDFPGELRERTSGALLAAGYIVKSLNPSNPRISEGYNPLHRAKNVSDIQKISKMLVINALGSNSKDPFWNLSAENLISLCTKFILSHTSKEFHSLYNVHYLISALLYAPEKVDLLFARTNDPFLLSEYKSFIAYGEKMLASIAATSRSALSLFATDPSVALVTSHDTINFSEFTRRKMALFINTNTKDMRYYSLVTSLFLDQFFSEMMSKLPDIRSFPLFFLIDEASSLYFPSLQITLSNIRKYNAGILQIYQSASQIVDLYGQSVAKAITENSYARVFMSGQPIHVAQELEATLGKFEYQDDKGIRHIRSLMTASEIRELEESIILCGNHRAIKTKITPYFKQFFLNRLSEIPPHSPENKLPFETPPLIQI